MFFHFESSDILRYCDILVLAWEHWKKQFVSQWMEFQKLKSRHLDMSESILKQIITDRTLTMSGWLNATYKLGWKLNQRPVSIH